MCSSEHLDVDHDVFIELHLDVELEFLQLVVVVNDDDHDHDQLIELDHHQYDDQPSAARQHGGARGEWNRPAGSTAPDDRRHVDGLALPLQLRLAAVPVGLLHDRPKRHRTELFARVLRRRLSVGVRRHRHEQRRLD